MNTRIFGETSRGTPTLVGMLAGWLAPHIDGLWRHRNFVRLWTAAGISAGGSQVTLLALPLTAILVLHASALEVAALSTAITIPNLALGLPAGVWLDRVPRRPVMVGADFVRAVVLASVPIAYAVGALTLAHLYVVAVVSGSMNVLFEIASQAYLPAVVPRAQLVEANAKLQAVTVAAQATGPSIGGVLVTLVAAPMAIVLDAASFIASGLLIGSTRGADDGPQGRPVHMSLRHGLREGAAYVLSNPYLRALLFGHALANLALGVLWSIVIVYAVRVLGLEPATIGFVLSVGHVGGFFGAVLARRIADRAGVGRVVVGSFFLFVPATVLIASATTQTAIAFVTVGWILESVARSLYVVSATSVQQALVPDGLRARVTGVGTTVGTGAFPLGTVVGGIVASAFGLREAMAIAAIAAVLPFLAVAASPVRSLRDLSHAG